MKNFRKNLHKYFCGDVIINHRIERIIEIIVTVIITAFFTASITQVRTIENIKNAQVDALMVFYNEYMDICHEVNNSECHWEFRVEDGVITDVNVVDDYGYNFNHHLSE